MEEKTLDFNNIYEFNNTIPENLYHYTSNFDSLSGILKYREIWMTRFQCLNDDEEFKYGIDLFIREIYKTNFNTDILKDFINFLNEEAKSPTLIPFIFSTCEEEYNEHLWEKYSNNSHGYNIQLRPSELRGEYQDIIIYKVTYNYNKQIEIIKDVYNNYSDFYNKNHTKNINNFNIDFCLSLLQTIYILSITFKNNFWHKEKEWRFIKIKKKDLTKLNFRHGIKTPIEYIKQPINIEKSINKISFGKNQHKISADNCLRNFLDSLAYNTIEVEQSLF